MKVKNREGRQANESIVQYKSRRESELYRFRLLKRIIESEPDVTIIVDTNQRVKERPFGEIEGFLQNEGIEYKLMPASLNNVSFFGFKLKPSRKTGHESLLVAKLTSDKFTQSFYTAYLDCYDIALGIGRTKPVKEICEQLLIGQDVLFSTQFFRDSVYDSVVCSMMRSSIDVKKHVEAMMNEVAL